MNDKDSIKTSEQKRTLSGVFHRASSTYDRVGPGVFTYFGRNLVKHASLPLHALVLDVACGRGAVLFPAAQTVGPQGHVIGIDFAEGMVAGTAREAAERGLKNIEVRPMDAEHLEFPDASFDATLCGFAIFFFPKLEHALAEFRRTLKPGGRIAFSTWGNRFRQEWNWSDRLFEKYLPPASTENPSSASSDGPHFDTTEGMENIMTAAGFTDVQVLSETADFIYANREEVWESLWSHGGRARLERIGETKGQDILEQFKTEWLQELGIRKSSQNIQRSFHVLYTLAVNPE